MNQEQREKLKQTAMKATPGPWIAGDDEDSDYFLIGPETYPDIVTRPVVKLHAKYDALYLAAANPAAILSLIAQVEALTVPQWISVEDQLPPIGQEVIVFVPGGRVPVTALMRLIRWEGADDFYWDNAYPGKGNMHIGTSITHWRRMPAAPTIPAIPGTKEGA